MDPHDDHADHRAIGRRLGLFHQQEDAAGVAFWHPRGAALFRTVEDYVRRRMRRAGYREVRTPVLVGRGLWEASGHAEKFADQMFAVESGDGSRGFALKPMSCPCHVQIFNRALRSHRELPLRLAEFGHCHRNEPSGALLGLMRGRAFVQDDAHVFCAEEQVVGEVARFCALLRAVYRDFGFADFAVGFSTRPALRAGSDAAWDRAEAALAEAAQAAGLAYDLQPGEGAFYGPKLEFILTDSRGRRWQCGTVQVDLVLPERLGAAYVAPDGSRRRPAMVHHAVLGSLERFIAILLEHHAGVLPLWLAPDQVAVAPVGAAEAAYAQEVAAALEDAGLRAVVDARDERLSRKIAEARDQAVPVVAVVGPREAAGRSVSLRWRDGRQEALGLDAAVAALAAAARPGDGGLGLDLRPDTDPRAPLKGPAVRAPSPGPVP